MEGQKEIKRVISIDFGSTNSQIGVRFFDKATGKPLDYNNNLESYLISDKDSTNNIPTILLEWKGDSDKKPENFDSDMIGNNAVEALNDYGSDQVKIISDFKKDLFLSDEGRKAAAEKYTERFLKYLHDKIFENGNKGNQYTANETRVILTVPARSTQSDKLTMAKLAENAGWGNIDLNEDIKGEESSALNYAVRCPNSALLKGLENTIAAEAGNRYVIMLDIGGSTTDIRSINIRPNGRGSYSYNECHRWPDTTGEKNTLGQIDIDEAVYNYFVQRGFILPDKAKENVKIYGYMNFRKVKEDWSRQAKSGNKMINLFGDVAGLDYDRDSRKFAPHNYKDSPVGKEEFELLIRDYIEQIQDAVRTVLKQDNKIEADVDYVILSGGGTKMYGIREMVTGDLNCVSTPLMFTKIIKDKSRCIETGGDNPSAICCMGNITDETKNIECKKHIVGANYVEVDIFTCSAGAFGGNSFKKMRITRYRCPMVPQ